MGYLLIGLIAVPVAAIVRSVFARHGMLGFVSAWMAFAASFSLMALGLASSFLLSGAVATVTAFLAVWGLSRARVLPEV